MISSSTLRLVVIRLICLLVCFACFPCVGFTQQSLDILLQKLSDPKPSVRSAAVQELSAGWWRFDVRVFRPLVAALRDTDPAVRKYAAMALRDRRNPRAVPSLLLLLQDPNPNIRAAVIDTLQETADPRAVEPLIVIWQTDKEERLRTQAFSAICFIDDMRATDALLAAMEDPAYCKSAIQALGTIGDDRAFEPLLAMATDTAHPNRGDALRALASFGDPRAAEQLFPQLAQSDNAITDLMINSLDPRIVPHLLENIEVNSWRVGAFRRLHDGRAVDTLIRLINDTAVERQTRLSAISALGAIRDPRAVPTLVKALNEKAGGEMSPCYAAITALGDIGDTQAVPALLPLLKDDSESIRVAVVQVLRTLRAPAAVDALLVLTKSQDEFTRDDAYYTLACIPDARAVQSVVNMLAAQPGNLAGRGWDEGDFFTALAANPSMTVDAYLTVLRQNTMSIFQALARTPLHDQRLLHAMVQWMVEYGENWMPDASIAQALAPYGTAATDALLTEINNPESGSSMVIAMLGKCGDQRAIPPLMRILDNADAPEAIIALGELGAQEAAPRLLKIAQSNDQAARWAALEALGALKEPHAIDILVAVLRKQPGETGGDLRVAAVRGLGKLGDSRAIEPLTAALQDDDERVYTAAAWTVLQLPPDSRTIEPLLAILHDAYSTNEQARMYAAEALARFPEERILFEFCQALHQSSLAESGGKVQCTLAHLLGLRKDPRAVRPLLRSLGDPDVATDAAWALGQIGDVRAVPALINVVNDRDPNVRATASTALKTLTGQDFGADHARWVAWWSPE